MRFKKNEKQSINIVWRRKNRCAYEEAVTKFIEEYMEMPSSWYVTRNNKKVLFPSFVHIAICILIAHCVFMSPLEVREEFFNKYNMVLFYNIDSLGYWE